MPDEPLTSQQQAAHSLDYMGQVHLTMAVQCFALAHLLAPDHFGPRTKDDLLDQAKETLATVLPFSTKPSS